MRKGDYQGIVVIIYGLLSVIFIPIIMSFINISSFADTKENLVTLLAITIFGVFAAPFWSWTDKLYEKKFKKKDEK